MPLFLYERNAMVEQLLQLHDAEDIMTAVCCCLLALDPSFHTWFCQTVGKQFRATSILVFNNPARLLNFREQVTLFGPQEEPVFLSKLEFHKFCRF
jgi:hypothetical protein